MYCTISLPKLANIKKWTISSISKDFFKNTNCEDDLNYLIVSFSVNFGKNLIRSRESRSLEKCEYSKHNTAKDNNQRYSYTQRTRCLIGTWNFRTRVNWITEVEGKRWKKKKTRKTRSVRQISLDPALTRGWMLGHSLSKCRSAFKLRLGHLLSFHPALLFPSRRMPPLATSLTQLTMQSVASVHSSAR